MFPVNVRCRQLTLPAFLLLFLTGAPSRGELQDGFDASSCLRQTSLASWLSRDGELVLTMQRGMGQGLQTETALSYGRYSARMRSDVGGGAVVAFYLMGVDNDKRNNPAYYHLHDEVDFELVNTLWREGRHLADNVTWFNAFYHHTAIILPRHAHDDAGGSMLAAQNQVTEDSVLFRRHVIPGLDSHPHFFGHNFNDGEYYTYTIDYGEQEIRYLVANDAGEVLLDYTLVRSSDKWPQTKMYLALTLWSAGDYATQMGFSGRFDYGFGRPMRVFVDQVRYQPAAGTLPPGADGWGGRIPWRACRLPSAPVVAVDCLAYNRDGVTCQDVLFVEGQVGAPFGPENGRFRCIDNCLHWISE